MIPAVEWAAFALRSAASSSLLVQVCGMVLLAGGGLLFFRAFRERYLLCWATAWSAYVVFRVANTFAQVNPEAVIWRALAQASFGLAVSCFVAAALLYASRSRHLLLLAITAAIGIDLALAHAVFWPQARWMALLLYILWTVICALGAAETAVFSLGRRSLGPWLLAVVLLLLPTENPGVEELFNGGGLTIVTLMASAMLFVVLEDAAARNRRLGVINQITAAVAKARDIEPLMSTALEELSRLTDEQAAWFRMLDGERLVLTSQRGLSVIYLQTRGVVELAGSASGSAIASGKPVLLRSSQADPMTRARLAEQGFGHVLILPLLGQNGAIGVLSLAGRGFRSYTPGELQFLSNTGRQLAMAVENLRLFDQVCYSHRQWVNTFDSIRDLLLVHDDTGRVIRANRALSERLGCEPVALVGRDCSDILKNVQAPGRCPYCDRSAYAAEATLAEAPDPCFGGYSIVSTHPYSEGGSSRLGTVHIIRDTTERRLAEQRYKLLFDGVQEGVFISTPEGSLVDCNYSFVRMLGYESRSEVMAFQDLASAIYADPGDRDRFRREMEQHGFVRNYDVTLRRKDGSLLRALESSFASRDDSGRIISYQGFLQDVSAQKLAEENLQRRNRDLAVLHSIASISSRSFDLDEILTASLERMAEVFAPDSASVYLLDPERMVLTARATLGEAHGNPGTGEIPVPPGLLVEMKRLRLEALGPEHLAQCPEAIRRFVAEKGLESWYWVVLWSDTEPKGILGLSYRGARRFTPEERELLHGIGRQLAVILDKVRLYDETRRAYDHLSQTQEQLLQSEKMSAVGQLISGVAHELNNPLTAILGYAQLLENEQLNERGQDFVQKIFRQAQRTHRVVQSLLDFSRQRKPQKESVDLRRVVEDTLQLRDYDLRLNNITIERDFEPAVPAVIADAHQIEQVFLNIINNAADAILEVARAGALRVRVGMDEGVVFAEFRDTGPGLKEVKRIFDPFYTTKKVGKGTGLGLSICYGIVKEHGGEILAGNHPEGGAIFSVRLPLAAASATRPIASAPESVRQGILSCHVLLVDDEAAVVEFEREVLTAAGARVSSRSSGEEAVALLHDEQFDSIVLDGKMPGGWTGFDIYRWLLENRPELATRVVLTLSNIEDTELRLLMQERHVEYLVKPFEVAELIAAIRRVISQQRPAVASAR